MQHTPKPAPLYLRNFLTLVPLIGKPARLALLQTETFIRMRSISIPAVTFLN